MTLELTAVALGAGMLLGVVLGLVGSSADAPRPASMLAAAAWRVLRGGTRAYVRFFPRTPLFVQILLLDLALMPPPIHPDRRVVLSGEAARTFRPEHGACF